jgi:hypothetical protein
MPSRRSAPRNAAIVESATYAFSIVWILDELDRFAEMTIQLCNFSAKREFWSVFPADLSNSCLHLAAGSYEEVSPSREGDCA